mmetsp:Transcript_6748/g.13886  ORF Transcript_6748/g.13886 Transcript_6748/m.13886 type:complete len:223 (-) Transcript_6748:149-817(-)|eukprot:CAMPEP_0171327658 /NCGR_PEP_ID=MMETSP0878-20121228/163_1 /TAXON_ID=67004 /ORGANISM="Thalassiosira weissflogii, Strain CCMP1336" /LENGTH=222 /DNA_ID=CAMNT_0011827445 /DNA_START=90 /DNA_END=758 /DNA_ORIENTATION=+
MSSESNNDEAKDEKLGIVDRLANYMFANPDSPFTQFADRQRVERLQQCREIEAILKACQESRKKVEQASKNKIDVDPSPKDIPSLATTKRSLKISRFFKWDSPHSDQDTDGSHENSRSIIGDATALLSGEIQRDTNTVSSEGKMNTKFSKDCSKETHELWACRALSIGCGNHVSNLRNCWDSVVSGGNSEGSCKEIQQNMARCVTKNTSELVRRVEAAKGKN